MGERRTNSQTKIIRNDLEERTASHNPPAEAATSVDEGEGCRVRAAASLFFFLVAQDRKPPNVRVSWVSGGSPQAPHAGQQR